MNAMQLSLTACTFLLEVALNETVANDERGHGDNERLAASMFMVVCVGGIAVGVGRNYGAQKSATPSSVRQSVRLLTVHSLL
jgi:hypothetical protein